METNDMEAQIKKMPISDQKLKMFLKKKSVLSNLKLVKEGWSNDKKYLNKKLQTFWTFFL